MIAHRQPVGFSSWAEKISDATLTSYVEIIVLKLKLLILILESLRI